MSNTHHPFIFMLEISSLFNLKYLIRKQIKLKQSIFQYVEFPLPYIYTYVHIHLRDIAMCLVTWRTFTKQRLYLIYP